MDRFAIGEPGEDLLFVGEPRSPQARRGCYRGGRGGRPPDQGRRRRSGAERLRARYGGDAEFLGRVGDERLAALYAGAAALVVPNVEEFGIAAVEAQAAGRPVVAVDAGGARETAVPGRTGLLVRDGDPGALARALREDFTRFDPQDIRAHAQRFSRQAFQGRLREIVAATC